MVRSILKGQLWAALDCAPQRASNGASASTRSSVAARIATRGCVAVGARGANAAAPAMQAADRLILLIFMVTELTIRCAAFSHTR